MRSIRFLSHSTPTLVAIPRGNQCKFLLFVLGFVSLVRSHTLVLLHLAMTAKTLRTYSGTVEKL